MMTTRTILTIVWVGEIRQGNMFDTKTRSKRWYTVCLSQCTVCAGPIDMVHCVPTTICAERQYVQHKNILDKVQTVPFTYYHICWTKKYGQLCAICAENMYGNMFSTNPSQTGYTVYFSQCTNYHMCCTKKYGTQCTHVCHLWRT